MDRQTQAVNGEATQPAEAPTDAIVRNMGELSHDLLTLFELQAGLAAEDVRLALQTGKRHAVMAVLAVCLAIGGLPMLLFGIAETISGYMHYSRPLVYLAVAAIALLMSSLLATISVRGLRDCFTVFDRSKQELIRNLNWLKTIWRKPKPQATPRRRV